jgi:PKD repeat protein
MSFNGAPVANLNAWVRLDVSDFDGSNPSTAGCAQDWLQVVSDGLGGPIKYSDNRGLVVFTNPIGAGGTWNFGNGDTSTETAPSYRYEESGTYTVTFTPNSGSEVYSQVLEISVRFVGVVQRANYVLFTGPEGLRGTWAFGDGTTSKEENPEHYFSTSGNYSVVFTSTTGIVYQVDLVISVPAGFVVNGNIVSCTSPTGSSGEWGFGDGSAVVTATNPTHEYQQGGLYTLSFNDVEVITLLIDSVRPPKSLFSYSSEELELTLDASDSINFTDTLEYEWYLDGELTSTDELTVITSADEGDKTVGLLVTDASGSQDYSEIVTAVAHKPVASVSVQSTNLFDVTFANASYSSAGRPLTHTWEFNDGLGGTSAKATPTHTYASAGTYQVSYSVRDDLGGISVTTIEAIVTGEYVAGPSLLTGSGLDTMDSNANGYITGFYSTISMSNGEAIATQNDVTKETRMYIDLSFLNMEVGGLYKVGITAKGTVGSSFFMNAFDGMTFPASEQVDVQGSDEYQTFFFNVTVNSTAPKIKIYCRAGTTLKVTSAEVSKLS